jgi:hypothetical protein
LLSNLKKLQELAAQAEHNGATLQNVEIAGIDGKEICLQIVEGETEFEISIPETLKLPVTSIDFETGQVSGKAEVPDEFRGWFNEYLSALVSDDDRAALIDLRKSIDAENIAASNTFRAVALGNFATISVKPEAINRALLAPSFVATKDGPMLVPILGLARPGNRGLNMSISAGGSFRVAGKAEGEILVTAGRFDSLHALNAQGRVMAFNTTFSVPMQFKLVNGQTFVLLRNFNEVKRVGNYLVPNAWIEGDKITMSHSLVGVTGQPGTPRETFRVALKNLDISNQQELWLQIRNYNMSRLFTAYTASRELKSEKLKNMLSASIASQIETMLKSL